LGAGLKTQKNQNKNLPKKKLVRHNLRSRGKTAPVRKLGVGYTVSFRKVEKRACKKKDWDFKGKYYPKTIEEGGANTQWDQTRGEEQGDLRIREDKGKDKAKVELEHNEETQRVNVLRGRNR